MSNKHPIVGMSLTQFIYHLPFLIHHTVLLIVTLYSSQIQQPLSMSVATMLTPLLPLLAYLRHTHKKHNNKGHVHILWILSFQNVHLILLRFA